MKPRSLSRFFSPLLLAPASLLALSGSLSYADEPILVPSSLSLGGGYSSSQSYSTMLSADLGLRSGLRLGLNVSGAWADTEEGPLSLNSNSVSFGTDPLKNYYLSFEYERWGQSSVLQTDSARLSADYSFGFLSLGASGEVRSIGWFSRTGLTDQKRFYSSSQGLTGKISIRPFDFFGLMFSAGETVYKDVPSDFLELEIFGFVSMTSLNLGSGFLQNFKSADIDFDLSQHWSLSAGYYSALTYIDQTEFHVITAAVDWTPEDAWTYSIRAGQTGAADADPSNQLEFGLRYLWF